MAIKLNTADYAQLNDSINALLSNGQFSSALMSVYTDSAATSAKTDSKGPMLKRQIVSVNAVYSHVDQATGNNVNGYLTIAFNDGTSIVSTDNVNDYWYTLEGLVYVPRRFGN